MSLVILYSLSYVRMVRRVNPLVHQKKVSWD